MRQTSARLAVRPAIAELWEAGPLHVCDAFPVKPCGVRGNQVRRSEQYRPLLPRLGSLACCCFFTHVISAASPVCGPAGTGSVQVTMKAAELIEHHDEARVAARAHALNCFRQSQQASHRC